MNLNNELLEEIKLEFLNMSKNGHVGYNISLETALRWLDMPYEDNSTFKADFKRRILKKDNYSFKEAEDESDMQSDYIIRKNGRRECLYFSNDGFKILCQIMSKSPKADYVRRYFIKIEKDYIRVLYQNYEETKKERDTLDNKLKRFINENNKLSDLIQEEKKNCLKEAERAISYYNQSVLLEKENQDLYEYKRNYYKDNISEEYEQLNWLSLKLYEKKYGYPALIYLLDDKWVVNQISRKNKKQKSHQKSHQKSQQKLYESDESDENDSVLFNTFDYEPITYNFNIDVGFEHISKTWIMNYINSINISGNCDNEADLYFSIGKLNHKAKEASKHYKLWETLYFFNENHYKQFLNDVAANRLNSSSNKSIYQIMYSTLLNIHRESLFKI